MQRDDLPETTDDWESNDWERLISGDWEDGDFVYGQDEDIYIQYVQQGTENTSYDDQEEVSEEFEWYDSVGHKLDQYDGLVSVESEDGDDRHILKIELTSAQLEELSRPHLPRSVDIPTAPEAALRPDQHLLLWVVEHVLEWAGDNIREREEEERVKSHENQLYDTDFDDLPF